MHFISTSDLLGPDWTFLAPVCDDPDLTWETHSGLPRNALERRVRRPHLARWRAALTAALAARGRTDVILVSHLPPMAAAMNVMRRLICPRVPQIAFAFNFTDLPTGFRKRYMRWALRGIAEFQVVSRLERQVYADELAIPIEHLCFVPWSTDAPVPAVDNPLPPDFVAKGYLCAVGGEGRDYALLTAAMHDRPELRMAVVARPHSMIGLDIPPNMQVFTNLPLATTWRIAADSKGMVITLKTETTACGIITLVGAQLLGLPLIISRSRGVDDYVEDGRTARMVPVGDRIALAAAMDDIERHVPDVARMAATAKNLAENENGVRGWVAYFADAARRLGQRS